LNGKQKTQEVSAENYDAAEKIGNKAVRLYQKKTGFKPEFVSIERLYKKKKLATKKGGIDWGEQILHGIGMIPFFFE